MSKLITPKSDVEEKVKMILTNLSTYFGEAFRVTLIARHVSDEKAIMVISEDFSYEKVIEALQRSIKLGMAPKQDLSIRSMEKKDA